jgi:tRNA-specific adenosine deaminase 3
MPKTGALTGDVVNSQGYGLFWRPDLNWKYLCWQWTENDPTPEIPGLGHLQV